MDKEIKRRHSSGLREIRERINQNEVVVFKKDTRIDKKKVISLENKCNHHLKQFNRMFCVGATRGLERRVADATTSTNVPPPPLYGLRKVHKSVPHPFRPLCGARIAPSSRMGHL
jgi:hypothetical protein